jgi:predicted MPP superfamily phosphohydrolase
MLVNEAVSVGGVGIAALDDSTAGRPDPAVHGKVQKDGPRVIVTHSPALLDQLPRGASPFHVAIAGHTHGGQVRAPGWAPVLPPGAGRFEAGWYETHVAPLYVSRGTGTSIVPVRFLCRPELPLFTLARV